MTSHRQTASFLQQRFADCGIRPDTRRGQNFLVDLNLVDLLVRTAQLSPTDVVLEVGTGTGSLTTRLAQLAAHVTIEVDPKLHQLAREELVDFENVTFLLQDALRNKNHFDDRVIQAIEQQMNSTDKAVFKLVANLPYNIATPVISNLLSTSFVPHSMTVTIQKELADRIVASPGTKDYGALSVRVQSLCEAEVVRIMAPSVFWPRPKVHSAIVHILHSPEKRARIADVEQFHSFVRSLFLHRRKFLRSVMISALKNQIDKSAVDSIMQQLGLGPDSRAEQLSVPRMIELYDVVRAELLKN